MEVDDTGSSDMKAGMVRVTSFNHTVLPQTIMFCSWFFFLNLFAGLTVADLVFPW